MDFLKKKKIIKMYDLLSKDIFDLYLLVINNRFTIFNFLCCIFKLMFYLYDTILYSK